ncbi:MAG TPA: YCF48-related protein [Caldimonas sp.]|nr:YCF48-related protein [Caldimonas sp.]HEX4233356.1 YCF48-related protein [Caldimonas sp.]
MLQRAFASTLAVVLAGAAWAAPAPQPQAPRDVLDRPALMSALAARSLVNGLTLAGDRVVAVGQRGQVLLSDDHGKTWQQGNVPVSSDLAAVSFPTAENGWAVGHDGVVLASGDGGRTWTRQLDGRTMGDVMVKYYTASGDAKWLAEAKRIAAQGAENPLLDVWFDDAKNGTVVGAFGLVLRTADGGKTWEPLLHMTDNPKALHLYAVRRVGADLYIAGEQGLLLKLDRNSGRFVAQSIPYQGTLFGVLGNEHVVLAFGLRGNVVRSTDGGRSWQAVATGIQVGLTAGTIDERGRIVLVSQAGHVLVSGDDGATFTPLKIERAQPAAAVTRAGAGMLVLGGPRGLQTVSGA